jgi:transketolase
MDEGIVWEALMAISNFGLNNVTIIVDRNQYQLDGLTSDVMNLLSIEDKLKAFGYEVETVDGHSVPALLETLGKSSDKPKAIVANTIKANGISFLMNNKVSHQCVLPKKKYELAVEEIKQAYDGK